VGRERLLIITADDFGIHEAVNEAVELASRAGALTATSLMMGAEATEDAVRRAHRLPNLRVGLHLVLADGHAVLPSLQVDALTDEDGRFGEHMAWQGVRFFALPHVRKQLEAEIRAQFRAFAGTGLALDHVNAHKHFHLHPTVLTLILEIGREFGLRAVRLPYEPSSALDRTSFAHRAGSAALRPWLALMKSRLRRAGVVHNDQLFGIRHSGSLDEPALLHLLRQVPDGVTEIYLHPGTRAGAQIAPSMHGYRHTEELAALLSPRVNARLTQLGIRRCAYGDL
jgi:hopanoid biosynthesis associated protein HpnK